jgi:hypothetical protein
LTIQRLLFNRQYTKNGGTIHTPTSKSNLPKRIKTDSDNQPNTKQTCKISIQADYSLFHLLHQDMAEQTANVKKTFYFIPLP